MSLTSDPPGGFLAKATVALYRQIGRRAGTENRRKGDQLQIERRGLPGH